MEPQCGPLEDMDLTGLFGAQYLQRRVLVTGHTGFKGSWLTLWLRELGAEVAGLALDPDTKPSHWTALELHDVADHRCDVGSDPARVRALIERIRPELVFHLAAQPLVRRGYHDPVGTFRTNVMGGVNVLESVRQSPSVRGVIFVTTDKVYEENLDGTPHTEDDQLGGRDPYAASKTCAEFIARCYRSSFLSKTALVSVTTARSGNVIGGGDWSEDRLIPDCVRALLAGESLQLRSPESVRPWQHVLDALAGYLLLGAAILSDQPPKEAAFNFGPDADACITVRQLVGRLKDAWPALAMKVDSRHAPYETALLRLDSSRAGQALGWLPIWNIEEALARTAGWYSAYLRDGTVRSRDDLDRYVADAQAKGCRWATGQEADVSRVVSLVSR